MEGGLAERQRDRETARHKVTLKYNPNTVTYTHVPKVSTHSGKLCPVKGHQPRQLMDLHEHVAARIRELRYQYAEGVGISQEALAKKLDVASNTVSRWETGIYRPSLEDLEKVARFFGKSILDFFPTDPGLVDDKVAALLRTAQQLPSADVEELRRYAEFRRARHLHGGERPKPGRKRKQPSEFTGKMLAVKRKAKTLKC